MTLQDLLTNRGIASAVVIDDGYDAVPRAGDLEGEDIWANFFADAGAEEDALKEIFPAYSEVTPEHLRSSDPFIAALWSARDRISDRLWKPFFEAYVQSSNTDMAFLMQLEQRLQTIGIQVIRSGRNPPAEAKSAKLILADLFLGAAQQDPDIERSLETLRPLIRGREQEPPCVILMSRSELLRDKKEAFRDGAELLGSMFRVYSKPELLQGQNLERSLERLAQHRPDAERVARFVHGWKTGLNKASDRFLKGIRRLDLSDYAQIRDVLLTFEGQPLGSYLLDVFDRVLAHEIEGDEETIDAAEHLNEIDPARYPAPHIAGSTDLQDLVFRTIWQNPMRLKVKTTVAEIPVGFGDVLVRLDLLDGGTAAEADPDACVVMTPACDLVREDGAKRALLLSGSIADVEPKSWTYGATTFKTPIMSMSDGRRVWIRWHAKDIRTLTMEELSKLLADDGGRYRIHRRLREAHALELQQRLLTEMGRIGLPAQMPGTFPVRVTAMSQTPNELLTLPLRVTEREGAVCYVGRDENGKEHTKLVMTEAAIDELLTIVEALTPEEVHPRARDCLERLKKANLAATLQQGLSVPKIEKTNYSPIKERISDSSNQDTEPVVIGLVSRNPAETAVPDIKSAALVLVINDIAPDLRAPLKELVVGEADPSQFEEVAPR